MQIHCLDAFTLERQYTIFTNPVVMGDCGSGGIGFGPLAVGPRWMAYSGSPVAIPNSGRVNPQHLNPSVSFPSPASNGSVVAHYAKESGRQLASGIVTLGDMGYKKLSKYYSELLPDGNNSLPGSAHADSVGMVCIIPKRASFYGLWKPFFVCDYYCCVCQICFTCSASY